MIFKLNTLYSFYYKPITPKHKLIKWDARPLIYVLDNRKGMILGVNIHWIKPIHQQEFIEEVEQIIQKSRLQREKIRMTYMLIKRKYRYALDGIRLYYIKQISQMNQIPKEKWPQVLHYRKYQMKLKPDKEKAPK